MQDQMITALVLDGNIRISAISGRALVSAAKEIHGLSRVLTAALGRQLMMTAIMAGAQKGEGDNVTTIIRGDGPAGTLVCTGREGALVKGYVANPGVEMPLTPAGKLDVRGAVGRAGKLTVVRDLNMREPYVGECNLVSGEIAEDFAQYYTVSEQQPSLVYLGVHIKPDTGEVLGAGGLLAQPMPGCPEEALDALQARAGEITKLTGALSLGRSLEDAVRDALSCDLPMEVVGVGEPLWSCDCSRERTEKAVIALGRAEIMDMIERDGGAELTCHFCNKQYRFDSAVLLELLREATTDDEG